MACGQSTPNRRVRSKLISLIGHYEGVFTDCEVAVGKTDLLKIKIVLDNDVKPICTPVRKIKTHPSKVIVATN